MNTVLNLARMAFLIWLAGWVSASGATLKTKNVVLITTDGLRWQEVFRGAEESLMDKENGGVRDTNTLRARYWRSTPEERRAALFPFLWGTVAAQGQLFGNQDKGSVMRVKNGRNFSYPGYNEFLCGGPDDRIISNAKIPNPNTNVFEWLNRRPGYEGRVSVIVNWDTMAWILNVERSRLTVWTGMPLPPQAPAPLPMPALMESLLHDTTPLWKDVILDSFTFQAALHHVTAAKPRAFYVAFGETDEWAHDGRYDLYLASAHNVDAFIARIWETLQGMPEYRDQTSLVITTDHGRGFSPTRWKSHGAEIEESGFVWAGVLGPDTAPLGERSNVPELVQGQVASTVAALVGEDFRQGVSRAAPPLPVSWEGSERIALKRALSQRNSLVPCLLIPSEGK